MLITFLTLVILLVAYYLLTCMLGLNDCKETMCYIYVVLTNTEQQPKLKLCRKKRHHRKFVIIIILFIKMSTSGLILDLTILEEQALNGTQKFANKYS